MYCSNCGEYNNKSSKYCKECGHEIKAPTEYAGFWIRFGAYFIDFIGVILLFVCVDILLALVNQYKIVENMGILGDYIAWVLYSTIFLSIWSTTPGKKMYGLSVSKENGERLDFKTAFIRSALQPLSLFFFGAGYWNMDKNIRKQAWHDNHAHTLVEQTRKINLILPIIFSLIGLLAYFYLRSLATS